MGRGLGGGVGLGVELAAAVALGVAIAVGVAAAVGVGEDVGVGVGPETAAQYLPPVLKYVPMRCQPRQTIISVPVQTAPMEFSPFGEDWWVERQRSLTTARKPSLLVATAAAQSTISCPAT